MNGIDISSYQSDLVPSKVKADFIIVKATQGTSYVNPSFQKHADGTLKAGKLLGIYHYAGGNNYKKEAQFFFQTAKKYIGKAIFVLDWESYQNSSWGKNSWAENFLKYFQKISGITPFIYMSQSVACGKWSSSTSKYPLWMAAYPTTKVIKGYLEKYQPGKTGVWSEVAIWQYSSSGQITGYSGRLDINRAFLTKKEWNKYAAAPAEEETGAEEIIAQAKKWLGSSYKKTIIDLYNSHRPLPRNYTVKYSDAWCATFISALAIKCNLTDIIPLECGCPQQIEGFKKLGEWVEDDSHVPEPGEIIYYDWQDSGSGDNKGVADHVGLIVKVSGKNISVIEGNRYDKVGYREITVNQRYIRGYGVPKYSKTDKKEDKSVAELAKEVIAGKWGNGQDRIDRLTAAGYDADAVQKKVNQLLQNDSKTYTVTARAGLNLRSGAGTANSIICVIPHGAKVEYQNVKKTVGGLVWYKVKYNSKTGYVSAMYLS